MSLVRIDVVENHYSPDQLTAIAQTVQLIMVDVFAAPERDRYQIITEHPVGHVIALDSGLGFERTPGVVIISVTQTGA